MSEILHVNSIAHGFLYTVGSFAAVVNSGITVELEPLDNLDESRFPWVGLYLDGVRLPPGPISAGRMRDVEIDLSAYVRASNAGSRLQATDALYRVLGPVLTAIHCDQTLTGAVHEISRIEVTPFEVNRSSDDWIQAAHILITAHVQVS